MIFSTRGFNAPKIEASIRRLGVDLTYNTLYLTTKVVFIIQLYDKDAQMEN